MPRHALLAAAQLKKRTTGRLDIKKNAWQAALWDMYDQIGEIRYGVNYKKNAIRKINFQIGYAEAPGEQPEIIEEKSNPAVDELLRLENGAVGGLGEVVGSLSVNLDIAAEGYFYGAERDDEERFEALSVEEIVKRDRDLARATGENEWEALSEDDFILRIWRPHPRMQNKPDPSLKPFLPQCEELLVVSKAARAAYLSRLSNGILLVPNELSFGVNDLDEYPIDELDGANEPEQDPWQAELIEAMMAPINDLSSAAAVVPLVMRGDSEYLANVRHVSFVREVESGTEAKINSLLTRIALGIDIPAEVLIGMSDANHWTAWLIDDTTYKQHIDPQVQLITSALTRGYLWPALQERRVSEYQRYEIVTDSSAATAKTDSLKDSLELFDRGAIGFKALLRSTGYSEDDMPDPEELERMERMLRSRRGRAGSRISTEGESDAREENEPGTPDSTNPAEVSAGNVATFDQEGIAMFAPREINATALAEIDLGVMARIQAAADAAVTRALERAGARLRTKVRNDESLSALIDGVDNEQVSLTLGRSHVEALQIREQDLIPPDTFDKVGEQAAAWFEQAQDASVEEIERYAEATVTRDFAQEQEDRTRAVEWLIAALLTLAAGRLFTADANPNPADVGEVSDVTVDSVLVAEATSIAGGSLSGLPNSLNQPNQLAAGIGNGLRSLNYIGQVGLQPINFIWRYGDPSARKKNFEPHQRLNGVQFANWTDDRLSVGFGYGWLGRSHYQPRDHRGCLCWYERVLAPVSSGGLTSVT